MNVGRRMRRQAERKIATAVWIPLAVLALLVLDAGNVAWHLVFG